MILGELLCEQEIIRGWANILALPEPARQNASRAFHQLALDQRGEPEAMGPGCGWEKNPGILHADGIWLTLIEHVGDLSNRMSKSFHVTDQACGYEYVKSKVSSSLRALRHGYGCQREIDEQIKSNYNYAVERGRYSGPLHDWMDELYKAGRRYTAAHDKLTVYNEAQWHAREAAKCLGKFAYYRCQKHLAELEKHLSDSKQWAEYAGLVMIDDHDKPIPFSGP